MTNDIEEELLVVESIYPDFVSASNGNVVQLRIPVALEESLDGVELMQEVYGLSENSEAGVTIAPVFLKIRHLPPVLLSLVLVATYPLLEPPMIQSIHSQNAWISSSLQTHLKQQLREQWIAGENVLCLWIDFIQRGGFLRDANRCHKVIEHPSPDSIHPILLSYDTDFKRRGFESQSFECPVCLTSIKGTKSVLLSCSHVTCHTCLRDYWSLHLKEGTVDLVTCPHQECLKKRVAPMMQEVSRVLSGDLVDRWTWLREKTRVERDPTIVFCPIEHCQAPVLPGDCADDSGWHRLRNCRRCSFAFCDVCRKGWHGPLTPCADSIVSKLVDEYISLGEESGERLELERRYGRTAIRKLVDKYREDQENRRWMEAKTTSCPGCNVKVEKNEGCNHMTCTKCKQHFCYHCGMKLQASNPYSHFSVPHHPCFNKLFDVREETADDDWIVML